MENAFIGLKGKLQRPDGVSGSVRDDAGSSSKNFQSVLFKPLLLFSNWREVEKIAVKSYWIRK